MEIASAIPSVRYIEPNWVVRSSGISTAGINVPTLFNDTYYRDYQWPLQHSRFEEAWQFIRDEQMTSRKVRVAVIDSGVDFGHPDLSGRLLSGVNYITPGTSPNDDFGHGTHITGIIAAIADNGLGIAGGVPEVEIDPLKMLGSNGSGSIANLVQAICDAANRNATVINMSLEVSLSVSLELVQEMQSAVDYAYLKGSLLVAAAGNTSGGPVLYPARLNHVIAVAGVTTESTRASYNPIGSALDIAAGGGDLTTGVLSTWPSSLADKCAGISHTLLQDRGSTYCTQFGTSGAAAHVSAGAAVLRSIWHNISVTETETFLESSAHDLGLAQNEVGAGLLDIEAARKRNQEYVSIARHSISLGSGRG
jgi:serine protease